MNKKRAFLALILLLISLGLFVFYLYGARQRVLPPEPIEPVENTDIEPEPVPEPEPEPIEVEPEEPYESPIDFEYWQGECSDIYAWIKVPGTQVDYPVVRNTDDPDYYLRKDIYGRYLFAGTLFTQSSYNGDDFSDRVTIIYGHNMPDGSMFGGLQYTYSYYDKFTENNEFFIYLPEKELHYDIIASLPFSNLHVMELYNRFETDEDVKDFLTYVLGVHYVNSCKAEGLIPTGKEHLVILQTCRFDNFGERYLVIGRLSE